MVGGAALALTGCGMGSYEIEAGTSVTILDEIETTRFVSAQESPGYPHYKSEYTFVVEQCDDQGDDCIVLTTKVDQDAFEKFDPGDTIVFSKGQRAYPVDATQ